MRKRWQQARIRHHQKTIDDYVDDRQWSRALTAVIDFAQWADDRIDDPAIWLEMTVSATRIVTHLEDPAEYRAFLTHFATPFLGDEPTPRTSLLDAVADIADDVEPSVMASVGRWLTDARPDWPLGPYLVGHFREIDGRRQDDDVDPRETATHFRLAARRADRCGHTDWYLHTRLREGALLLTTGADRRRGRRLLGDLDWSRLAPAEQLWMAVALTNSTRWTDRVRSMDIILDLHGAVTSARPDVRDLRLLDLRRAASTIFKLAGLDLPETERRRLEQLSTTLFSGDEQQQWHSFLKSRQRLSKVASLPFDQAGDVLSLVEKLAAVYPDRWQPANQRLQLLNAGWHGDSDASPNLPSFDRRGQRLPVADAVARLLDLFADIDDEEAPTRAVETGLDDLFDTLTALDGADAAGSAARPVALVWPRLLAIASRLDLEVLAPKLATLATHHTAIAPAPGYGWWTLAAHLYDAGLDDAARTVAEAAVVDDRATDDDKLRDYVATRTFQEAVDRRDTQSARRWLERLP